MELSLSDNWKIFMSQYTFKSDSDFLNKDLFCTVCDKFVLEAYQTHCGCQYCHGCIKEYLIDGSKYCLGDKEDCKKKHLVLNVNVVISPILNKKVMDARVYCPNKTCLYITDLARMQQHLKWCTPQSIESPLSVIGCDNEAGYKDDALQHSQSMVGWIYILRNEIIELKGYFNEEIRMKDVQIENLRREMSEEQSKLMEEIKEERKNTSKNETEIEYQKKKIGELLEEIDRLGKDFDNKEAVATLTRSLKGVEVAVDKMADTIEKMSIEKNNKVAVGLSSLTVDRFSERSAAGEEIISPYFYSHENGYKLRLSVDAGGCGEGRFTHLSLFFHICEGEYDDVLPWPCMCTINIGVINQRDGGTYVSQTHNYVTTADAHKNSYDKPINGENRGLGSPIFVSLADLESVVGLVVEDSVIVRCVVSAPP